MDLPDVRLYKGIWSENLLKEYPDFDQCVFVFGDNLTRQGNGGQAVIRDLPNAFGIATKVYPCMNSKHCFFNDYNFEEYRQIIDSDIFTILRYAHTMDKDIVLNENGYGHGKAKMPEKAPKLYKHLNQQLNDYFNFDNQNGKLLNETT